MEEDNDYYCEWSEGSLEIKRQRPYPKPRLKQKPKTPEEIKEDKIIRILQGALCKGRYYSWMLLPDYLKRTSKKQKDKKKPEKRKTGNNPSPSA